MSPLAPVEPILAAVACARPSEHLALARALYEMRNFRSEVMPGDLFGEPGWDVLLDLYVSDAEGSRISVTALCIGSRMSITTGLRYIRQLEKAGMAVRTPDDHDGRRWFVRLTDVGRAAMDEIFSKLSSAAERSAKPPRLTAL